MWKDHLKEYFRFTARERAGIFVLIGMIVLLQLLPYVHRYFESSEDPVKITLLESMSASSGEDSVLAASPSASSRQPAFFFDPNQTSSLQWQQLGVNSKTAQTILNYRAKGGRFFKADDLRKIYGLSKEDADRLIPYVKIAGSPQQEKTKVQGLGIEKGKKTDQVVEINAADSMTFRALPGIGSRLAARIVAFREKLGGFFSVDQIAETYFLPDSTFRRIRPFLRVEPSLIKKMNINEADFVQLVRHPYIDKTVANAILQYRRQHGAFEKPEDIQKVMVITDSIFRKLRPYIGVGH